MNDNEYIQQAIAKAKESVDQGGFPAGAVVVMNGKVVGEGISIGGQLNDPTAHGEMTAIRQACKNLKSSDLSKATLYASMQPCLMCFGAAVWSAIPKIMFACRQAQVSPEYYGGHYDLAAINVQLNRPLQLAHLAEHEAESLTVVHTWEKMQ